MRELFGNPEAGTFLAWLADGGLWAILVAVGAVAAWFLIRLKTRRLRRWALERLDDALPWLQLETSFAERQRFYDVLFDIVIGVVIIGGAASLSALAFVGIDISPTLDSLEVIGRTARDWAAADGAPILVIVVLALLIKRIVKGTLPRLVKRGVIRMAGGTIDRDEVAKRSDTLTSVMNGTANALIFLIAGLMILSVLSIPIGPALAGLGIAGIAVGFGAQWLIRDLINGIFIIAENQYRQGDVVTVGGVTGLVESINLRRTTMRDLDGKVHSVPNGQVSMSTNWTKNWSRVNLDVGVAYRTNLDHVFQVLNRLGQELAEEPYWGEKLIEPPQVLRVNSFDDSAVTIKVLGVCRPLTQWEIMGELRRRIKIRFDEEGIEIPFPHRTIYWGLASHPLQPALAEGETEPGKIAKLLTRAEELREEDLVVPSQFSDTGEEATAASGPPPVQEPLERDREALKVESEKTSAVSVDAAAQEEGERKPAGSEETTAAEASDAAERRHGPVSETEEEEETEGEKPSTGSEEEKKEAASTESTAEEDEDISDEERKLLDEAEKSDEELKEQARRQAEILSKTMDQ